jgi:pyridoxal phosphate-dependent aminotransferase EpsN
MLSAPPKFKHRIPLSVPHMDGRERRYVDEAFKTNWLSTVGPNLSALEKEFRHYAGVPALALASCTAAIHLGFRLLGVKPGDEVVVPTLTFVAGANPILYEGGKPVFIDSEEESWNLDPHLLKDFLKKRARENRLPRAVSVTHLFGQSANLDAILEICREYQLPLLEDAAEAVGTLYQGRPVGAFGDIGAYSLNGNKIITSTAGGILLTAKSEWIDKARYWSTQACDRGMDYLHSEVGYNYRMSNVLAGIARGQMEILEERVARRREIAFHYRDAFADLEGIDLMPQAPWGRHTNWLSCFLIDEQRFGMPARDLLQILDAANIDARPVWKPLHTQKLYEGCEVVGGDVAERLNRTGLCLPSASLITEEEQQFVIDRIREAARAS